MFRTLLNSKIHRATVTQADIDYIGSITIDSDLMKAAQILPYEKVHVVDIDNGARLETYAIEGEPGSGVIGMNGAAARLIHAGDRIIVMSYAQFSDEEARDHRPTVVLVDDRNRQVSIVEAILADVRFDDLIPD
jgi:aspartate 1-decarboxylase